MTSKSVNTENNRGNTSNYGFNSLPLNCESLNIIQENSQEISYENSQSEQNSGHFLEQESESQALSQTQAQEKILQTLFQTRLNLFRLFGSCQAQAVFDHQIHPEFSPIGWHLGHIAYTESLWILVKLGGIKNLSDLYAPVFANFPTAKAHRTNLPSLSEILDYVEIVRVETTRYLANSYQSDQARLWYWLIQHEVQHCETIALLLELNRVSSANHLRLEISDRSDNFSSNYFDSQMVNIPAGEFWQGSDQIFAQDNEQPKHLVKLDQFAIDRFPVTVGQYREFILAGGYQNPTWWSAAGWQWLQTEGINLPQYWQEENDNYPVCGVSWYEADAYARAIAKRLPTEAEWEKAATGTDPGFSNHNFANSGRSPIQQSSHNKSIYGCQDLLGNVWEWTATKFAPYPGFVPFPYLGYSATYFDQDHYVLRGGSWATGSIGLRSSFRNWYQPDVRQILAGFRCAINY